MTDISDTAFILAAGFGKRLRPHTADMPKPMVTVGGRPMIDHALDQLSAVGIKKCVVNTHYRAEVLHKHLERRISPKIIISHEPEILDTGGGLKNGLQHFNNQPFLTISGDSVWGDNPSEQSLQTIMDAWDDKKMDILMLLQDITAMQLTRGIGDYTYNTDGSGRITRSLDQSGTHMFTSIRIHHPRIFEDTPDTPFSYLDLMDRAEKQGRLYGVEHKGLWHHISTPTDLENVRSAYKAKAA